MDPIAKMIDDGDAAALATAHEAASEENRKLRLLLREALEHSETYGDFTAKEMCWHADVRTILDPKPNWWCAPCGAVVSGKFAPCPKCGPAPRPLGNCPF